MLLFELSNTFHLQWAFGNKLEWYWQWLDSHHTVRYRQDTHRCPPWLNSPHDDVIQWTHSPRYWPFVQGIHRWPVNFPHKAQRHGALIFSLICAWANDYTNSRNACDLRRHRSHCHVTVMVQMCTNGCWNCYLYTLICFCNLNPYPDNSVVND